MSEILTQNQIDQLLSELLSGNTSETDISIKEKKIKTYDFKSPKKFSKDQLKVLRSVYESFARHLAAYLSGILRSSCQIKVDTIEEMPYFEYNNALPDLVMMGVFDVKQLDGSFIVELSSQITFTIVEILLGGSGTGKVFEREFTEIEIALMRRIFKQMEKYTKDSWANFAEMEANLMRIETNSRIMQTISMEESVVIIVMEVEINSIKGTMNVCIPIINLEPYVEKSNRGGNLNKRSGDIIKDNLSRETVMANLKDAYIDMVGIIGDTALTLGEIINLQVGDVIKLRQTVDSDIKICIGGKPRFTGIPGIIRNKKHIKITNVLNNN
ncbi:MAG TPA: flagellar motor switch protein FliM [Candidatus Avimonas sp.]|nr:flagellar motor switch protein FliM [Clostridiales bacterium]HPU58340.1 flagellar motor switch protein FliM [Candidatus Avimonas sp.]